MRLPAGQLKRVDAAAALDTGAGHALLLTGNRPGWRLEYLEVSNAHGFTRGWVDLVIAPAARGTSGEVPVWAAAAMWIVLLLARPRLRRPHRSIAGWIHVVATGVVLLFFGCLLGGPVVTHFKPLLAWRTFTWCAVVLYAEPLWRLWRFALFDPGQLRPFLRYCPHVAIGALFVAALCQFYEAKTGFTQPIVFGDEFYCRAIPALRGAPHAVEPGAGYDGQFDSDSGAAGSPPRMRLEFRPSGPRA